MSTTNTYATSLKVGSNVVLDGAACKVVSLQVSRPGKHGHAKVRVEAVGMLDSKKRIAVMPGHDSVEVPLIIKKQAQVLSVMGDNANLMDAETFETFDLPIPEELKGQVVDGVTIVYWQILADKMIKQIKVDNG